MRSDDEIRADLDRLTYDASARNALMLRISTDVGNLRAEVESLRARAVAAERERDWWQSTCEFWNAATTQAWAERDRFRDSLDRAEAALAAVVEAAKDLSHFDLDRRDVRDRILAAADVQGPDNPEPTIYDEIRVRRAMAAAWADAISVASQPVEGGSEGDSAG